VKRSPSHSCRGKIKHPTMKAARASMKAMKGRRQWRMLEAYKCLHCPAYHIGRKSPPPLPMWARGL
jgi:hypothetical protein